MKTRLIRLAILISGSGSTMESVLKVWKKGELKGIEPVVVIASTFEAKGIQKAKALGVATYVVARKNYRTIDEFGDALLKIFRRLCINFISQNGWLPLTPRVVIDSYDGRMINQHPGPLDPGRAVDFGGKGMYGARVTAARLLYTWVTDCDYWTEATVHKVTGEFDKGELVATSRMRLPKLGKQSTIEQLMKQPEFLKETVAKMQAALLEREHALVINTLRKIGKWGRIPSKNRRKPLVAKQYISIAQKAKVAAIQLYPHG